jgi:hypothetical protein
MFAGKKTYILGFITVISAAASYLVGDITAVEAAQLVVTAVLGMTIRNGIK